MRALFITLAAAITIMFGMVVSNPVKRTTATLLDYDVTVRIDVEESKGDTVTVSVPNVGLKKAVVN